jgi:dTDP-4-dehydrorhamnose 3,5-epimerase
MIGEFADKPTMIDGNLAVDDRGQVSFVNSFQFDTVKRFYMVSNHTAGFVRAWHAHQKEGKFVYIVSGSAIVCAVPIDNWETPDRGAKVERFVMSAQKPSILYIPRGYANGFKTLTEGTRVMFFSTSTLEDSKGDDFRYDARIWNPWDVVER